LFFSLSSAEKRARGGCVSRQAEEEERSKKREGGKGVRKWSGRIGLD